MANENTLSGFMITCSSCAARLKVNKPSLIGQMLACPKCGTMLKVVQPATRPASPSLDPVSEHPKESVTGVNDSIAPTQLKTMLTTGDFDEIEQLLISNPQLNDPAGHADPQKFKTAPGHQPKSPAPKVNPLTRPKPSVSQSQVAANQESSDFAFSLASSKTNATASSNPLLPNDQWISHAAQKRRQMMTLLAAAISLILVLLTIVIFLLNGFVSKSSTVAQSGDRLESKAPDATDPQSTTDVSETSQAPVETTAAEPVLADLMIPTTTSPNQVNGAPDPEQSDSRGANDPGTKSKTSTPDPDGEANGLSSSLTDPPATDPVDEIPPILNDEPPPVLVDDAQSNPRSTDPAMSADVKDELPVISPQNDSVLATANPVSANAKLSNLDRLSQMIEGSQLSIGKFKDLAASARDEQRVGLPKYFIERNQPTPVDIAAQLSVPCGQMKFESIPLSIALRDLMTITGVPMTIDVDSVIAQHGSVNPLVESDVQGVNFSQAIEVLLQSAELVKLQPEPASGLIIAAGNRDEFVNVAHDLPNFLATGDEERKAALDELSAIITGMIVPDSWKLEQNPARLSFSDSAITVINSPIVQFQVRELLKKVREVVALPDSAAASDQEPPFRHLATKHQRMQTKLELPSGLEHRFSGSLIDVLDLLSAKTGVVVLGDWESLRIAGLGPLTAIPGNLTADSLRNALKELTQTLEITYLIIDDETILLTSFDAAVQRTDLEVYSFRKLLNGKVTEEQALSILNQSLAEELKNPAIRSYYSKRWQGLFVVAPQMLHRKIEVILRGLESL
jgi:hypothetical protein